MPIISKRLTRWLNVVLIFTMLSGMLPPASPANATTINSKLSESYRDISSASESQASPEREMTLIADYTADEKTSPTLTIPAKQSQGPTTTYLSVSGFSIEYNAIVIPGQQQLYWTNLSTYFDSNCNPHCDSGYFQNVFSTLRGDYSFQATTGDSVSLYTQEGLGFPRNGHQFRVRLQYTDGTFLVGSLQGGGPGVAYITVSIPPEDNGKVVKHIYLDVTNPDEPNAFNELFHFYPDQSYITSINPVNPNVLPPDTYSCECPFSCTAQEACHSVGGPINTSTGNYNYGTTDLSLPSIGQPLRFERTYNSMPISGTVVYSRPLGYGWTHNYDLNLTLADDVGGEPGMAILKAPHGSRLRFFDNGDGTYSPYSGVWANMVRQGTTPPYTYVITTANQTNYTFGLLTNTVATSPIQATPAISLT